MLRNNKYIKLLQLSTKWLQLIYKFTPILLSLLYTQKTKQKQKNEEIFYSPPHSSLRDSILCASVTIR